jgi:hypothetical protein
MRALLLLGLLLAATGCGDPAGPTQRGLDTIAASTAMSAQMEIRQLRAEIDQYHFQHGEWPTAWSEVRRPPVDPWGNPYRFAIEGGEASVVSAGPDGEVGTADDVHAE